MLKKDDLDAPAQLTFIPQGGHFDPAAVDWSQAEEIDTLREALHRAVSEEPPAARHAVIKTKSGEVIAPDRLDELWDSVQGP